MWPATTFHVLNEDRDAIYTVPLDHYCQHAPCGFCYGICGNGIEGRKTDYDETRSEMRVISFQEEEI